MQRIFPLTLVALLFFVSPQPAHANMLRDARKVWKEKVIAPIASPLAKTLRPSIKWKELSSEKKSAQLEKAKEKIEKTTHKAFGVLEKFERRPRFQHTAVLIRLDLEDGMDRVKRAETPKEFEDAVQQLQESWNSGKEELRSEL